MLVRLDYLSMYKFSHHLSTYVVNAPETTATPQRSSPVKLALQNSALLKGFRKDLCAWPGCFCHQVGWDQDYHRVTGGKKQSQY